MIKAEWDKSLPRFDERTVEKKIKLSSKSLTWNRYRYCKEMSDFWNEQLAHSFTNNAVEGLRALGGFWTQRVGRKDVAHYVGHVLQFVPGLGRTLARRIDTP